MKPEDNRKNEAICRDFCGNCPSHPGTDEQLFCVRGKSGQTIQRNGCLCPACQIYADYELERSYFCDEGAAQ